MSVVTSIVDYIITINKGGAWLGNVRIYLVCDSELSLLTSDDFSVVEVNY